MFKNGGRQTPPSILTRSPLHVSPSARPLNIRVHTHTHAHTRTIRTLYVIMTRRQSGTLRVIIYHSKTDAHETFSAPPTARVHVPFSSRRRLQSISTDDVRACVRVIRAFYQYPVNFPRTVADTPNWKRSHNEGSQ